MTRYTLNAATKQDFLKKNISYKNSTQRVLLHFVFFWIKPD